MGVQRDVLTLANILTKVATGDELELVAISESKLREAGHCTLWWSGAFLGVDQDTELSYI